MRIYLSDTSYILYEVFFMSKERKIKAGSDRSIRNILKSTFIGLFLFAFFSCICAVIIANSNMELNNIKYLFIISLLLASFATAVIAAFSNRNMKGLIVGLLTSFMLTFVIMLCTVIINAACISGIGYSLFLSSVIIGIPGGIIGANLKQ